MKVEAVLFASRAFVSDGLLTVEGAGWEQWHSALFPATVSGYVTGVFALDDAEHGELPEIVLEVFDDSGQIEASRASMIANGTRPKTVAGVPCRVVFAIPFMTAAEGPTVLKARLESGGSELALITCSIQNQTPDALPDGFGS